MNVMNVMNGKWYFFHKDGRFDYLYLISDSVVSKQYYFDREWREWRDCGGAAKIDLKKIAADGWTITKLSNEDVFAQLL